MDDLLGTEMYAANTAPFGMTVKASTIPGAGAGVFTTEPLVKNVRLGPYRGEVVKLTCEERVHAAGYAWQVRFDCFNTDID